MELLEIKQLHPSWHEVLKDEFHADYFQQLSLFLQNEKAEFNVYPSESLVFNAFNKTPFDQVKVVLMGQDPYHGTGQAHGLSFSVPEGIKSPPSLKNIFKEINQDMGFPVPEHGNLERWAEQGVLLLNATLTVREKKAGSHQKKGWEIFTDKVIIKISQLKKGVIFLLWGNYAKAKEKIIDTNGHFVLKAHHPSPFSAANGFFGCKHFSKVNEILRQQGLDEIDWQL